MRWRPRLVLVELFAGAAGGAVAFSRLPVEVVAHISCEIDPAARRLIRRRWAGVIELGNIESLTPDRFQSILEGYKRDADWVFIVGGSPCQDLAGLSVVGHGLEGSRSQLFYRIPALLAAAEVVFPRRTA